MSAVVQATAAASVPAADGADTPTRFLLELDKTWSICRLYGTEHPAFRQGAAAAAATLDGTVQVSISPTGFSSDRVPLGGSPTVVADLRMLAQRLRRMGLVGLTAESGLTPPDVASLVTALHQADRGRVSGDAVAKALGAATGQRVRAVPLRLGDLNLVAGTAAPGAAADAQADPAALWHELFSTACFGPSGPGEGGAADAARALESAMRGVQSRAHWDAMVGVWLKELSAVDPASANNPPASAAPITTSNAPGGTGTGAGGLTSGVSSGSPSGNANGTASSGATSPGGVGSDAHASADAPARIDAIAAFLKALSPAMSQRLLGETIASSAAPSEHVVLALTNQLPAGVVLGALSAIDRTGAAPSSAALAVLRSVSAHVMDERGGEGGATKSATPRTNAELAEIGSSLERLLGSNQERSFVPDEYLRRRDELTRGALRPDPAARTVVCPTEADTRRHAAGVVLQLLASPDASPAHLAAGLQFLRHRAGDWIRGGEFDLVGHAADVARALAGDDDPAVAAAAQSLLGEALGPDELIEASRRCQNRAAAVAGIAGLLRQGDGEMLVTLLRSPKLVSDDAVGSPVGEAIRQVLPTAGDVCFKKLLGATTTEATNPQPPSDAKKPAHATKGPTESMEALPAALLPMLAALPGSDAARAVESMLPHASPYARYAVTGELFRRNVRWPLSLTDQLLRDTKPGIRRLALMRLVRDNDLATAARYLAEASAGKTYAADVAVGLAELLRRERRHPDVRPAYRKWFWSRRRWVGLLSLDLTRGKGAT